MSHDNEGGTQPHRPIDKFGNVSSTGLVIQNTNKRYIDSKLDGSARISSIRKLYNSSNKLEFGDKVDSDAASISAMIRKSDQSQSKQATLSSFDTPGEIATYYQPQTKNNEHFYLAILDHIKSTITGLSHDGLISLVDDLIILIKNDTLEKPKVVETNVKTLVSYCSNMTVDFDDDRYNKLFTLVGRISDYIPVSAQSNDTSMDDAKNNKNEAIGWLDIHKDLSSESDNDQDGANVNENRDDDESDYDPEDSDDQRRQAMLNRGGNDGDDDDDGDLLADISYNRDTIGYTDTLQQENNDEDDTTSSNGKDAELSVLTINQAWLQKQIQAHLPNDELSTDSLNEISSQLLQHLQDTNEEELNELFNFSQGSFISFLLINRLKILSGICLSQTKSGKDRKIAIQELIQQDPAYEAILSPFIQQESLTETHTGLHIHTNTSKSSSMDDIDSNLNQHVAAPPPSADLWRKNLQILDLDAISYQTEQNAKYNKPELHLPADTQQVVHSTHIELVVPAAKQSADKLNEIPLIEIASLPKRAQLFFPGVAQLNRIQSSIYSCALKSSNNMLICAPTGAGKTNCAMLTISREILQALSNNTLNSTQIVYIAPMKALVREVVSNIQSRFVQFNEWLQDQTHRHNHKNTADGLQLDSSIDPRSFPLQGIQVQELSGDIQVTAETLSNSQILVATPEKWDILTRKENIKSLYKNVKLVIIDEIHLLQDTRGPVLESIVARGLHYCGQNQHYIRFVGLSATLANYHDVAKFLRVDPSNGLFFFDSSYRPCPLQMNYVAIQNNSNAFGGFNLPSLANRVSATSGLKGYKYDLLLNQICFQKFIQYAPFGPVLVFVHSRRDTLTTAKYLLSQAKAYKGDIKQFLSDTALLNDLKNTVSGDDSDIDLLTNIILKANPLNITSDELSTLQGRLDDAQLKDLIQYGFGIHHGGLSRSDREIIEDLYAQRKLHTLVTTATLAWGVNLPAHTVIIKGTTIYNPERGAMTPIFTQDVIQMLGRAGRPQYDSCGDGVIISSASEIELYISAISSQLPIESSLLSRLCDLLNAEVVNGNITTFDDALTWFNYTYFSTRLKKNPIHYNVQAFYGTNDLSIIAQRDPTLRQYITSIIYSSLLKLSENKLINFNLTTKLITPTIEGMIASKYYITYETLALYCSKLDECMSESSLLHLFSLSKEFKYLTTRNEEKVELELLLYQVPIVINESIEQVSCKVNILLQAYISRLLLKGLNISTDMIFISQNAARLMWCLYDLLVARKYSSAALTALQLALSIQHRVWPAQCPLRQFIPPVWSPRSSLQQQKQPLSQSPLLTMNPNLTPQQLYDYDSQYNLINTISATLESTEIDWFNLISSSEESITDITKLPSAYNFIHNLPHIWVNGAIQPLTSTDLKLQLKIITDFDWVAKPEKFFRTSDVLKPCTIQYNLLHFSCHIYSSKEPNKALYIYPFSINRSQYLNNKDIMLSLTLSLPLKEAPPSVFYVYVTSTQFLHCSASTALPLSNVIIPPTLKRYTNLPARAPLRFEDIFKVNRSFLSYYAATYAGQAAFSPILSTIGEHLMSSLPRFGTDENKNLVFASTFDKHNYLQFYDLIVLSILMRARLLRVAKLQQKQQKQPKQNNSDDDDEDEDEIDFGKAWIILPTQPQVNSLISHWNQTQLFTKYLVQQVADDDTDTDDEAQGDETEGKKEKVKPQFHFESIFNVYALSTDYIGDHQNDIRHCHDDHIIVGTVEQFTRLVRNPVVINQIFPQLNYIIYNDLHLFSQELVASGYLAPSSTSVWFPTSTTSSATAFTSLYETLIVKIKHTILSKKLLNNIKVIALSAPIAQSHDIALFIGNCVVHIPNSNSNQNESAYHYHSDYCYYPTITQYPRDVNVVGIPNNHLHQELIQTSLNHNTRGSSQPQQRNHTLLSPSITNAYLSFLQNSALIHRISSYCATGQALIWSSSNDTAFIIASYIASMLSKYSKIINNNRYTALFNFVRENKLENPFSTNLTSMDDSIDSINTQSTRPIHHNPLLQEFFQGKYQFLSSDSTKDMLNEDNNDFALTTLVHCSDEILEKYLTLLSESNLEYVIMGIGVVYAGIDPKEEIALYELYQLGYITILIANIELCYQLPISLSANFVAIMDMDYYNNQTYQYEQLSIGQLLTLARYADPRTAHNTVSVSTFKLNSTVPQPIEPTYFTQKSRVVVYCGLGQSEMLNNQITSPMTIESALFTGYPVVIDEDDEQSIPERERSVDHRIKTGKVVSNNFIQALVADIAYGSINDYSSAMQYIPQTFFSLRFKVNPHYYNLASTSMEYLRDYLTNFIRSNVSVLNNLQCISLQNNNSMIDANDEEDEEQQANQKFVIRRPGRIMSSYLLSPSTLNIIMETLSDHSTSLKFYDVLLMLSALPDLYNTISIPPYYHPILAQIGNKYQLFAQQQTHQRTQQSNDSTDHSSSLLSPSSLSLVLFLCYFSRLPLSPVLSLQLTNLLHKAFHLLNAILDLSVALKLVPMANLIIRFIQHLTYAVLPAQLYLEHANQVISGINPMFIQSTASVQPEPGYFLPPAIISLILKHSNSNPRQQLNYFNAISQLLQIPHFTPQFILFILTTYSTTQDPINVVSDLFSHDHFGKIMSSPHALNTSLQPLFSCLVKSDQGTAVPLPTETTSFVKAQKLSVQRWITNYPSIDVDLPDAEDNDEDDESNPIRHKCVVQEHPTDQSVYKVQLKLSVPRYTDENIHTANQYTLGTTPSPNTSTSLSTIPFKRRENWYLSITDPSNNDKFLFMERLKINHEQDSAGFVVAATFDLPKTTTQSKKHPITVHLQSDAFIGSQFILDQNCNNAVFITLPDRQ